MNFISGKLIRWNDERGFGFIEHENYKCGIFVHISAFKQYERRPLVGDVILFQLLESDKKAKAFDAYIKGVKVIQQVNQNKLYKQTSNKMDKKYRSSINYRNFRIRNPIVRNILIFILLFYCIVACFNLYKNNSKITPISQRENEPSQINSQFHCDGRIYCSQMTSREEADYFADNCPGVKMRSSPGEACKNDSRW